MRQLSALWLVTAAALGACAPKSDVAVVPPAIAAEGPLTGGGGASGWTIVTVYDERNRTLVADAVVHCHETGDTATTDGGGRARLDVPATPFTISGGRPGSGLVTVAGVTAAAVGLPLPSPAPRTVGVRGTVTQIVDATASRVEVPDGRGGLDPLLATLGSDTYQLTMAAGRNFRVTALEIGSSGLRNLVISPPEWKVPSHKTVVTVDLALPMTPPALAACSGGLTYPAGFTAALTEVRGRARHANNDLQQTEGTVVGWGTTGPLGLTYSLSYAPTLNAMLAPSALVVDAQATDAAGNRLQARIPNATGVSPDRFPLSANLVFPAPAWPLAPAGGTGPMGATPTLVWTNTVASGAGCYRVALTDLVTTTPWVVWVAGGSGSIQLPGLPAALAALAPQPGSTVAWQVEAIHLPGLAWSAVTLDGLAAGATGRSRTLPESYTR